jgi:Tol biopolymer transport system component
LQKQTGLTLATDDHGIEIVLFDKRSLIQGRNLFGASSWGVISRDGTEVAATYTNMKGVASLAIVQSDSHNLREYPGIRTANICWSYDKSKLALTDQKDPPDAVLEVIDWGASVTEEIDPRAKLTSQCWSPDDKKIVYEAADSIRIYEIGQDKSTIITVAKGENPTWSPDGRWIAFLDRDTYYAIHPDGHGLKKMLHKSASYSGLLWSPDARIVAYVSEAGLFEGAWRYLDAEIYRLRVRRLEDNSEDWVAEGQLGESFQWVTSPSLIAQTVSDAKIMTY